MKQLIGISVMDEGSATQLHPLLQSIFRDLLRQVLLQIPAQVRQASAEHINEVSNDGRHLNKRKQNLNPTILLKEWSISLITGAMFSRQIKKIGIHGCRLKSKKKP